MRTTRPHHEASTAGANMDNFKAFGREKIDALNIILWAELMFVLSCGLMRVDSR